MYIIYRLLQYYTEDDEEKDKLPNLPPFSLYCFFIGRMADEICFFNKDTLIVKAPKRSPLALRMVVLLFALACGVYICLICLRQTRFNNKIRFLDVRVIEQPCPASGMKNLEIPNVHFPMPKTFSRDLEVDGSRHC